MEKVLHQVAQTVEKQLDNEIERLDALDAEDIAQIRQQRLADLKLRAKKQQEWLANGHGTYTELDGEKEFFSASGKSERLVCHFYRGDTPRCAIFDMHLKLLAQKHPETRFVKLDVERAPFLTGRLRVRVIPTLALVVDNKTGDFVVGFADLGNRDDFSTEVLEWRLARGKVIEYSGDALGPPPAGQRRPRTEVLRKTIRDDDSDDLDLSD